MTASRRWSRFPSAPALLVALAVSLAARATWAQACCGSVGLVSPARLRIYEDGAAGFQARGKSALGAFDKGGIYTGNAPGDSEWDFEQDFFGVVRVLNHGQVAVLIPVMETRRTLQGVGDSGGGIGDVAVTARYDFIAAGDRHIIPGIALLLGIVTPTGTPTENAHTPAGATGQGSFQGSIGVGIEQAYQRFFVTMNALVGLATPRNVGGVHESFGPTLTATLAAGSQLPHEVTMGVYISATRRGVNSFDGGTDPGPIAGSDLLLLTSGLAATLSLSDQWRIQSTAFGDLPIRGLGRNEPVTGIGASLSVMRLWP